MIKIIIIQINSQCLFHLVPQTRTQVTPTPGEQPTVQGARMTRALPSGKLVLNKMKTLINTIKHSTADERETHQQPEPQHEDPDLQPAEIPRGLARGKFLP